MLRGCTRDDRPVQRCIGAMNKLQLVDTLNYSVSFYPIDWIDYRDVDFTIFRRETLARLLKRQYTEGVMIFVPFHITTDEDLQDRRGRLTTAKVLRAVRTGIAGPAIGPVVHPHGPVHELLLPRRG